MDIASGLLFLSGAIAGFGLGWLGRSPRSIPLLPPETSYSRQLATSPPDPTNPDLPVALTSDALLQQAPIGYLEVDDENQLLWINPLACQMLGINAVHARECTPPRLLLELVRSYELDQLIEATRQQQAPRQSDWVLNLVVPDPIHPSEGTSYALRGYGIPLENRHVGVFLENRQEAELLIQQRNRWTSDVAHELKTPLTSIRLVAETLRDRVDAASQQWLDRLLNEILRLSNLVEDLLNLSRLERSGGQGLTLTSVELPRLILSAWQMLEPLAEVKQLEIAYEGPSELRVKLDETLMYRVFINLIDNAIKFSPREGTIYVQARCETVAEETCGGHRLWVDVIDEGCGFRESDLPYIFNRFYRADPSRSRDSQALFSPADADPLGSLGRNSGTGLGLAIVQQIVEAHGGTIAARNHERTGGGWLTLSIPTELVTSTVSSTIQEHPPTPR